MSSHQPSVINQLGSNDPLRYQDLFPVMTVTQELWGYTPEAQRTPSPSSSVALPTQLVLLHGGFDHPCLQIYSPHS